jgi:hypothetical protein
MVCPLHLRLGACLCTVLWLDLAMSAVRADDAPIPFAVQPAEVALSGNFAQAQLLIGAVESDGTTTKHSPDLTHKAG